MKKDYLYNEIADNIANKIKSGVLKAGEKLPSVRNLSAEHGISINTAKRAFLALE
jgi:DNA-binding transcriptional regulator YhcF (GntR family)